EVEHELARDGLQHLAFMAKRNAMPLGGKGSRFEQRIFHSRHLLLHGFQRLPDHRRAHFPCAQVPNLLYLEKVKKRIALACGYQSGLFPSCELTRRKAKYAKQVRSTISIHGCMGTFSSYYPERQPPKAS